MAYAVTNLTAYPTRPVLVLQKNRIWRTDISHCFAISSSAQR